MNRQAIVFTAVVCLFSIAVINGLPTLTRCSGKAANIMFVLDSSSSIWIVDYKKQLNFVETIVKPFDIGPADSQVHVGAITFSNNAHLEFSLDEYTDKHQLKKAISNIPYRKGETNTAEALDLLRKEISPRFESATAPFIAIVITDGMSRNTKATRKEAERLHELGVNVFAIGVGHSVDLSELESIASDSVNNVYQVSSYSSLENIVKGLNVKACEAIVITTTTTSTPAPTTTTTPIHTTTKTVPTNTITPTAATTITTTPEITPRDASSTVSFGYDLAAMGAYRSHMIHEFINNLLPHTGYGHFGVVSYAHCPETLNAPLISLMDQKPSVSTDSVKVDAKLPAFVDIVRRMRTDLNNRAALNANRGHVGSQVAVLFVDPSVTELTPELMKETDQLKRDGSKVFLVNVGRGMWQRPQDLVALSSQPYHNYMYNYPTYDQLLYTIRHIPLQFSSMLNKYVPNYY